MRKYITPYNVFLFIIILLNLGGILAPIFMSIGLEGPAKVIYLIYSFFCHQIAYRSLHIHDYQYAWCTRDTFIWLGLLISAIIIKIYKIKGLKFYHVILFTIPIALDGGIQLIATMVGITGGSDHAFYASTNFTRMITGALLGIGLAFWIFPSLQELNEEESSAKSRKKEMSRNKAILISFFAAFVIYLGLIGLWAATSNENRPANIVDQKNRFPEDKSKWFERRKDAVCPTNIEDQGLFDFSCK